jgi:hypothetical protein
MVVLLLHVALALIVASTMEMMVVATVTMVKTPGDVMIVTAPLTVATTVVVATMMMTAGDVMIATEIDVTTVVIGAMMEVHVV